MKNFIMDYCLPLQISTFGPIFILFLWVKKCHISLPEKLPKWHFLTHAFFDYFLQLMSVGLVLKLAAKSNEKLVNQK